MTQETPSQINKKQTLCLPVIDKSEASAKVRDDDASSSSASSSCGGEDTAQPPTANDDDELDELYPSELAGIKWQTSIGKKGCVHVLLDNGTLACGRDLKKRKGHWTLPSI